MCCGKAFQRLNLHQWSLRHPSNFPPKKNVSNKLLIIIIFSWNWISFFVYKFLWNLIFLTSAVCLIDLFLNQKTLEKTCSASETKITRMNISYVVYMPSFMLIGRKCSIFFKLVQNRSNHGYLWGINSVQRHETDTSWWARHRNLLKYKNLPLLCSIVYELERFEFLNI